MEEKRIIKHMITTILIVIVSFFIWNNAPCQAGARIAASYNDRNMQIVFDGFEHLICMEDDNYIKLTPTVLNLRNTTNKSREYKLYFTIAKTSTVPYDSLKLAIDDTVYDLKNTEYIEDDTYIYFLVKTDNLDAYTNTSMDIRIWTTVESGKLISSFITR